MAKARLLQAVCTVALLAAAPAFAQQTLSQPADTGAGNSVNNPVAHDSAAPRLHAQSNMAPAEKMDSMSDGHATHHSGMMGRSSGGMHARTDTSQNATVDQLNDQSYQAAQRGQTFSATDSGSSGSMAPMGSSGMGSSGRMGGMSSGMSGSGGSSSPASAASGSGGGSAGAGAGSGGASAR